MTIYPNAHKMDGTVDVSLACFPGQPRHQLLDSTSFNTESPPQSSWSERYVDKNGMSITFREVFQNFKENTKSADLIKIRSQPQSKQDRIADAFKKTEKLLLSNDNVRPVSRSKNYKEETSQYERKSSATFHSHISDEKIREIFSPDTQNERLVASPNEEKTDDTNNASENHANLQVQPFNMVVTRKGKKQRKRTKTDHKARRIKPGRLSVPSTGIHDGEKRLSARIKSDKSSTSNSKPRISSEPISSKQSHQNVLSYTLQTLGSEKTNSINKQISFNSNYRSASDVVYPNQASDNGEKTVPSTHYTHGSVQGNTSNYSHKQSLDATTIQIQPFTTQKVELSKRVKSGHSIKSTMGSINSSNFQEKPSSPVSTTNQFTLTTKSCNLPYMNTDKPHDVMHENLVSQKTASSLKESTLTAIYGPQHNIPHRAFSNADDFRKVKKIFLSEKQSGTLKESGMEFPCAPPATPMPDVMKRYEYVPCMNDIRSQRAVKSKLQAMEREALRRKEKQKEANDKLEKQQSKDREKTLKIKQRRQIYALNQIMTELEHKRFLEFCHGKGLNT